MSERFVKIFLRWSIGIGFLSAVADRFGFWPEKFSAWGNWISFEEYTAMLIPWLPSFSIPFMAWTATIAEVVLGILLIIGYKVRITAFWAGVLLLVFALSMAFFTGVKRPLDASVFTAAAGAFALSILSRADG